MRNLEREIGTVCRKIAREVAEGKAKGKVNVSAKRARELLGRQPLLRRDSKRRTKDPGVATGLAWTPVGGDVLFIEATAMPGSGKLTITGQLGDVMRESAQAALSWVRRNVAKLAPELAEDWFAKHDIHVHVPAGAVPKDGPSAGVAMTTALASLVTGKPVSSDVAMTGEVTLDRPGAAGGRAEGEVARGPAGRDQAGDRSRRATRATSPRSPSTSSARSSSSTWIGSRRRSRRRSVPDRQRVYPPQPTQLAPRRRDCAWRTQPGLEGPPSGIVGRLERVRPPPGRGRGAARTRSARRTTRAASAYGRLQKQKRPATALMDDKKVHRELRDAAESLRDASDRLRGREKKKGSFLGKLLVLAIVGAVAALILSEDLRKACSTASSAPRRSSSTPPRRRPSNGGPDA